MLYFHKLLNVEFYVEMYLEFENQNISFIVESEFRI